MLAWHVSLALWHGMLAWHFGMACSISILAWHVGLPFILSWTDTHATSFHFPAQPKSLLQNRFHHLFFFLEILVWFPAFGRGKLLNQSTPAPWNGFHSPQHLTLKALWTGYLSELRTLMIPHSAQLSQAAWPSCSRRVLPAPPTRKNRSYSGIFPAPSPDHLYHLSAYQHLCLQAQFPIKFNFQQSLTNVTLTPQSQQVKHSPQALLLPIMPLSH